MTLLQMQAQANQTWRCEWQTLKNSSSNSLTLVYFDFQCSLVFTANPNTVFYAAQHLRLTTVWVKHIKAWDVGVGR